MAVRKLSLKLWATVYLFSVSYAGYAQPTHDQIALSSTSLFRTHSGQQVTAPPGDYRVDVGEETLRLSPTSGGEHLVFQATRRRHSLSLTEAVALAVVADDREIRIYFLKPGGEAFEAIGALHGTREPDSGIRRTREVPSRALRQERTDVVRRIPEESCPAGSIAQLGMKASGYRQYSFIHWEKPPAYDWSQIRIHRIKERSEHGGKECAFNKSANELTVCGFSGGYEYEAGCWMAPLGGAKCTYYKEGLYSATYCLFKDE